MKLVKKVIISISALIVSCGVSFPVSAAENAEHYKIVFVGDSGVGKTSLINKFMIGTFIPTEPTKGCQTSEILFAGASLHLWDTAGQEAYRAFLPVYFRDTNAFIIVLDQNDDYETMEKQINYWYNLISEEFHDVPPCCVLANKKDKIYNKENAEEYISRLKELCDEKGFLFAETSDKTGEEIEKMLYSLVDVLRGSNELEAIVTPCSVI